MNRKSRKKEALTPYERRKGGLKKVFHRTENNGTESGRGGNRQYLLDSRLFALFDRRCGVRIAQQHRAERHDGSCDNSQPSF